MNDDRDDGDRPPPSGWAEVEAGPDSRSEVAGVLLILIGLGLGLALIARLLLGR